MEEEILYIPFSNGTEFMMWYDNNCEQCANLTDCALENDLALGTILGGIPSDTVDAIGHTRKERQESGAYFCDLNRKCNCFKELLEETESL